jgi:ADP-ribose pyrophosphatase YjhB (NUDIX family)
MLTTEEDLYNGFIINPQSTQISSQEFKISLKLLIADAQEKQKNLLWLDLTTTQAQHIAIALELGFEFHNCEKRRTTLTYQVKKNAYIPVPPSHTMGVGAVVINNKNEILLVRDKIHMSSSIYKIPGGMLEEGNSLQEGVQREVWEETGIKTKFIKMVSVLNAHPFMFNKSNMYLVFKLEPLNLEINIIDTEEIEKAFWMPLDEFFAEKEMSAFQKELVIASLNNEGISLIDNKLPLGHRKHIEVYA